MNQSELQNAQEIVRKAENELFICSANLVKKGIAEWREDVFGITITPYGLKVIEKLEELKDYNLEHPNKGI